MKYRIKKFKNGLEQKSYSVQLKHPLWFWTTLKKTLFGVEYGHFITHDLEQAKQKIQDLKNYDLSQKIKTIGYIKQ